MAGVWRLSLLLILAVGSGAASRHTAQKPKVVPMFFDMGVCKDKKHHLEIHNLTSILDEYGASFVSADVVFLKGMKTISKFHIIVHKCTGGKTQSLCEYYLHWTWTTALCRLIPAKQGMLWSPFYTAFDPPFDCPIHKGPYKVRNATLDMDAAAAMVPKGNLHKYIWSGEIQLYDEVGELVVCLLMSMEARIVKGRADSKGPPKKEDRVQ